eukprot:snap_masked-scaffold_1-processed-gene-22.54-mRNA-1 protein AED:1.00 eAED:1.00 QI:0/-1/0/0/-1/1/1/0/480
MKWKLLVGVEVHARINSPLKLFSHSPNTTAKPNLNISPLDLGLPGSLPILNHDHVSKSIATGVLLKARINPISLFERKHYFYQDSPNNFQITQQSYPVLSGGHLRVDAGFFSRIFNHKLCKKTREIFNVEIDRVQLEHDTAKPLSSSSILDMNRSGVGVLEIVTKPCMQSKFEVAAFANELRNGLRNFKICNGDLFNGELRFDVNITIENVTAKSQRIEVKNLNSFKNIIRVIEQEQKRLEKVYEEHGFGEDETRGYDEDKNRTYLLRKKDKSTDYRFMPEPDIPPLAIADEDVKLVKDGLPETFTDTLHRYKSLGVFEKTAYSLLSSDFQHIFEYALKYSSLDSKLVANVIVNNLIPLQEKAQEKYPIQPDTFVEILDIYSTGIISKRGLSKLLSLYLATPKFDVHDIIQQHNLSVVKDNKRIREACMLCYEKLPEKEKKKSKKKLKKYLLGRVIHESNFEPDPASLSATLDKFLEELK